MQSDLVHLEVQENKDDSMQEDIEFLTKEIEAIDKLKEEIQSLAQAKLFFCFGSFLE
jgi:Tfp pilus assembly protein PilN